MKAEVNAALVVGGRGMIGRRVVAQLVARGIPTRIGSPFEWDDRSSWSPALRGVRALVLCRIPGAAADAVPALVELAAEHGVQRLVLLSGRGEHDAAWTEQAVRASSLEWTIVRAGWLSQSFSEGCLLEPVVSGEVALPARQVGEPFVDAGDVADVVVGALSENPGRVHELTGPRLLTFAEAIEEVAEAAGRPIRYRRVSPERHASLLAARELLPEHVEWLTRAFAEVLDGRNAHLTDGVRRALAREPRDFGDYARDAAAAGAWRTMAHDKESLG